MLKAGWIRLWVVITVLLLAGVSIASAYFVWGKDACYGIVTVSIADTTTKQIRELAESMKQEATNKMFCGAHQYSEILTLESLAQQGVVTQIGIQWLEPDGWSYDLGKLDVLGTYGTLNTKNITASEIVNQASGHVRQARLLHVIWFLGVALTVSLAILAIGFCVAWVRRGFGSTLAAPPTSAPSSADVSTESSDGFFAKSSRGDYQGGNIQNLYEAILGEKNRIYYLTKFESFDQQGTGLKASWNWPALLAGGVWALYRKMYGWFFAFWGVAFLSNILEKAGSPGLSAIIFLVPWIAFPIYADSLYYKSIKKKIAVAQLSVKDELKLLEHLRYKGGVHTWVIWVFGGLPVIGILAAILIPMFARH